MGTDFPSSFNSYKRLNHVNNQYIKRKNSATVTKLANIRVKVFSLTIKIKSGKYDQRVRRIMRDTMGYSEQMINSMIISGEHLYIEMLRELLLIKTS